MKVQAKTSEVRCVASTDSKLRAAWQRRSLAMDMAGLATFIGRKGEDGKEIDPAKRFNLPECCCDRNDKNQPLCFLWNQGNCKWKGKGKRCNRGFHQCYLKGCFRDKPYIECTHTD